MTVELVRNSMTARLLSLGRSFGVIWGVGFLVSEDKHLGVLGAVVVVAAFSKEENDG